MKYPSGLGIRAGKSQKRLSDEYLFVEIEKKVSEFRSVHPDIRLIDLGIGDVSLPLPRTAAEAAAEAAEKMATSEGFHGYPSPFGSDFLRSAVGGYYKRHGVTVSEDEIFVSDGAKSDIADICELTGNSEVLLTDPGYPAYLDNSIMSNSKVTLMKGTKENGFLPPPPKTKRPYVIFLCSPGNPTGAAYSRKDLEIWVNYAVSSGSLIVFDSAYSEFITDEEIPRSVFDIDGSRSCAVEIMSFSKFAGFTGMRAGATVIPSELRVRKGDTFQKLWKRNRASSFNGLSYVTERAAAAVLSEKGLSECKERVTYYLENASILSKALSAAEVFNTGGVNSPYIWLQKDKASSVELFEKLLGIGIVGTPGRGFGKMGEGFLRLTGFSSREKTEEASIRLFEYFTGTHIHF